MKAKQVVILLLFLIFGAIAGTAAALAFYWNRATALPTWYASAEDPAVLGVGAESLLQAKLASGDGVRYGENNQVEITLSEAELNQVIVSELARSPDTARFLQAAQGINTTIDGDRINGGVVVSMRDLPTQDLPPDGQRVVQQAVNNLPMLRERDIYVGVEGSPRLENGRLIFDEDTRIRLGNMRLTVPEVARLLGISPAQLQEQIDLALPQAGLVLDGIEFVDGNAILRGVAQ
jgi:hypothetical protein